MKTKCALAVVVLSLFSPGARAAQKVSLIDAGVVMPVQTVSGDLISATMVMNPKDYALLPGLRVVPAQLPVPAGATDPLSQFVVQIGNGAAQPANKAFSFTMARDLTVQVRPAGAGKGPGIVISLPAPESGAGIYSPEGFRVPPMSQPGGLQIIHGPLSGDANGTSLMAGGTSLRIVAETPRALYFLVPPTAPAGLSELVLNDHGRRTRLRTWNLTLQMSADKTNLLRGESTAYHVLVRGLETIPREAWFGSGAVPELIDPGVIRKFLPDFKPPSPVQPGVVVLTIENLAPGAISISGGDRQALTFTYGQSKYEQNGTIVSRQTGGFNIDGTLIPFLHDLPGEGLPGEHVPNGPAAETANDLRQRAKQLRQMAVQVQDLTSGQKDDKAVRAGENAANDYNRAGDRLDQTAHQVEDNATRQPTLPGNDQQLIERLQESARFWHDEAEKARRWAREATDEKTRKLWEDQARWEDANARRREDLISQMQGRPPGTVAKADPPPPPVPTTPETPTLVTPGQTPVISVPQQPVNSTTRRKQEEDCPQRGMGCVALIIDFSHNVTWEFDMASLSKKMSGVGCDTDYVAPDLWEIPLPYDIGVGPASYTVQPDPEDQRKAREHNDPEWKRIRDALEKHRARVSKGVELAIEIVNGHGYAQGKDSMACGAWVWKEYTGDFLLRSSFHDGNYRAANKNVCGWFTSDFSCYGGLTPKVVDELENLTTSTCAAASTIACGNHAGWEADASMSSASSTQTCSNGSIGWQGGYIRDVLDKEAERRKDAGVGVNGSYTELIQALHSGATESATSRYGDRGYAKDKPPIHARGGYGECSGAT